MKTNVMLMIIYMLMSEASKTKLNCSWYKKIKINAVEHKELIIQEYKFYKNRQKLV